MRLTIGSAGPVRYLSKEARNATAHQVGCFFGNIGEFMLKGDLYQPRKWWIEELLAICNLHLVQFLIIMLFYQL